MLVFPKFSLQFLGKKRQHICLDLTYGPCLGFMLLLFFNLVTGTVKEPRQLSAKTKAQMN